MVVRETVILNPNGIDFLDKKVSKMRLLHDMWSFLAHYWFVLSVLMKRIADVWESEGEAGRWRIKFQHISTHHGNLRNG